MYQTYTSQLLAHAGKASLTTVSEAEVVAWCTAAGANNSVRARLTAIGSFLAWCEEHGVPAAVTHAHLRKIRRRFPKTYGKVQSKNPGRWLTHDQAFGALIAACQDGSLIGLRDELIIRLGLTGLRVSEIGALVVGNVQLDQHSMNWIGKRRTPLQTTLSPKLAAAIGDWMARYAEALSRPLRYDDPLLCPTPANQRGDCSDAIAFGSPIRCASSQIGRIVKKRAIQAGLGHVAPHDLRRSAAGILHRATTADGAHHFDLLDIQKVLHHADPATTMRSYLDPMDTGVFDRAASILD